MKKVNIYLLMICTLLLCGYNEETGKECTHQHNNECGYATNQCIHFAHKVHSVDPRIERGGG